MSHFAASKALKTYHHYHGNKYERGLRQVEPLDNILTSIRVAAKMGYDVYYTRINTDQISYFEDLGYDVHIIDEHGDTSYVSIDWYIGPMTDYIG